MKRKSSALKKCLNPGFLLLGLILFFSQQIRAQVQTLDEFETKEGWYFIQSDGAKL